MRYYCMKTPALREADLTGDILYVAKAMDGRTDLNSPAFLPKHRAIADEFCRNGLAFRCARGFRGQAPGPIRGAYWAITGLCNLRCAHCYMSAPRSHPKPPDLNRLMLLADRLAGGGAVELVLTGGEVFTFTRLEKLLDHIGGLGIAVSNVLTNATLVTEATPRLFLDRGMLPRFHVSFDGVGHHSRFRGVRDAEARTLRGIRILRSAGFSVGVNTSVDLENLSALEPTYECLKALDIDEWGIARPLRFGCARDMTIPPTEVFAKACAALQMRWLTDGRPMTLGLEGLYSYRPGAKRRWRPMDLKKPTCRECLEFPYVSDTGRLMPCSAYTDSNLADTFPSLYDMAFDAAWQSESLRRVMEITLEDVLDHSPDCRGCEHLAKCKAGCRASALINAGSVYAADPYCCEIMKHQWQKPFYQREDEYGK